MDERERYREIIEENIEYEITKHPKYRQLSDYNKRNAFDIEKYRQHKLVVKPDDTFDLYDMGEVDAD